MLRKGVLWLFLPLTLCLLVCCCASIVPSKATTEPVFHQNSRQDEYTSRSLEGPGGRLVRVDMPMSLYMWNTGGSDGLGLCVFTSIQHTSHYQGLGLDTFRKWMERRPGGGWPEKVDRTINEYTRQHNLEPPSYIHMYGRQSLKQIQEFLNEGRSVCITWGTDYSHYGGRTIAHMVNCVYLDDEWGCVLDNNFIEEFLWVKRPTFDLYCSWTGSRNQDGLWAIVFMDHPIPQAQKIK